MDEVGGDEWGSFRSTLSRNLKWLSEPDMQAHLASFVILARPGDAVRRVGVLCACRLMKSAASKAGCA